MSSTESSTASPSPPASPTLAGHHGSPGLERLVQHFVSAKRALSTTQHVEKVTHLVNSSRTLIEQTAILNARNVFATAKVHQQIDTLHAIHRDISSSGASIDQEFTVVIANLDAANDRLQKTLAGLKAIIVDSSLQRAKSELDEDKTLFDFVDESQYEDVSESVRTLIDNFQASRMDVENSLDKFKDLVEDVSVLLQSPARPDSPSVKATIYDEPLLSVAEAFGTMEEHAAEIANLLQSLIAHYDLCVSALKHTEGGQEAVRKAVLTGGASDVALDESLFEARLPDDISDEDRTQMMTVLEGDAEEVDEVVGDIRERSAELERLHEQFLRRADTAKASDRNLKQAVGFLQRIRVALPVYIDAATSFQTTWSSIQASIDSKMKDIVGFRAFYEEFLAGYKKLLREVDRRHAVENQMKKLALKAQKELDQLYKADNLAREEFVEEVASFLPSDLWPGVTDPSVRWVVNHAAPPSVEDESPVGEIAVADSG
ncbi:hypothetical protein AMS68_000270 [Peltaster fructicola]|uniref:Autophagy-related protein 17 n=1 Tax=Peltaster fructicola TaxID=286661 RepID=A0A6H0XJ48_9PEZI|nr:hypothetical protein AMS68_000270 [Peltaster fructicola]